MKETYLSECLEKFHDLPDQIQDLIGGFDACLLVKKLEDAYNVSLSFSVILVAIGELTIDDLPDYLNLKFKLDKQKGLEIADKLEEEIKVQAKIRYSARPADAILTKLQNGRVKVSFKEKQRAMTKGQSVVFYDNEVVVGGGIIETVI